MIKENILLVIFTLIHNRFSKKKKIGQLGGCEYSSKAKKKNQKKQQKL